MKYLSLFILSLALFGCQFSALETGANRWQKFVDLEPEEPSSETPTVETDKGVYKVQDPLIITVTAAESTYFYVFLMLPNNDVYLLTPGSTFKNHKGPQISLAPDKLDIELYAPNLVGTTYVGVIASPQNLSVISDGWLSAEDLREFDTWPADLPFDTALDFMTEALDEKPWSLVSTRFVISP
jgi:hypothetical protein